MIGISFFIEQFLGLITGEIWDCSKETIRTAYKNNKNATEEEKSFETRMYTAIVDAFCYYVNVNPKNARPDIMDFIYTTAEVYFNESQRKQDNTPATLLDALHSLDSKFGDTTLFKNYKNKKQKDDAKIETVANYLQKYIVKDDKFKDEYINEVLTRLLRTGERIEKMQLEQQLFPEQIIAAIKESEDGINATTIQQAAMLREEIHRSPLYQINETGNKKSVESQNGSPFENNEKSEYIKKWYRRLFLHRRPEDKPLTLDNTFITPPYVIGSFNEEYSVTEEPPGNTNNEERNDLEQLLEDFFSNGRSMIILGQPGMGKSSIVSFLANKYKDDPNVIILRFKNLALDAFKETIFYNESLLLNAITNKLCCTVSDLEHKILILDGYDEIKSESFEIKLIKKFILLTRGIKDFRFIITSRPNYINVEALDIQKIITLSPFSELKIKEYSENIRGIKIESDKNINREVFGIPVILYMALAADIDLSSDIDRASAYYKIFALNGGIIDRFWSKDYEGYEEGAPNIMYVKESFFKILCNTAFYMFENIKMSISYDEYKDIIEKEESELLKESPVWCDFPIDNLYEHGYQIEFVHKSIFEYFTALYIFNSLKEVLILVQDKSDITECGKRLSAILSDNLITNEILAYLKCMMLHSKYNNSQYYCHFKNIFIRMILGGIPYFVPDIEHKALFLFIQYIFANLLQLVHAWDLPHITLYDFVYNFATQDNESMQLLAQNLGLENTKKLYYSETTHTFSVKIFGPPIDILDINRGIVNNILIYYLSLPRNNIVYNLSFIDLQAIRLKRANLNNCNFSNSNLADSDMQYADLRNSSFKNAILTGASFHQADLRGADLTGAIYTNELDDAILE